MEFAYAVYTLSALPGEVAYVGRTVNPTQRMEAHLSGAIGGEKLRAWVKGLSPAKPKMRVVCVVQGREEAVRTETAVIAMMKQRGHELLNVQEYGGAGGPLIYEMSRVTDVRLLLKAFSKEELREQKRRIRDAVRGNEELLDIGK